MSGDPWLALLKIPTFGLTDFLPFIKGDDGVRGTNAMFILISRLRHLLFLDGRRRPVNTSEFVMEM